MTIITTNYRSVPPEIFLLPKYNKITIGALTYGDFAALLF